jgi:DNA-binding GntR family transcriptional regulator
MYQRLRTEILDGTLAAGSVLFEVEQASRLGVSRTPVREALARLVAEGLVAASGGRGLVVTTVQVEDVQALFELRACLEATAAQLAAPRRGEGIFEPFAAAFRDWTSRLLDPALTPETVADYYALIRRFDAAVDAAGGNGYLLDALENLRTHVGRVRRMAESSPERLAMSADEHALIAEAIAGGDAMLAGQATHVHLRRSLAHFTTAFQRQVRDTA